MMTEGLTPEDKALLSKIVDLGERREKKARQSDGFECGDDGKILKNHPANIRLAIEKIGVSLKQNDFAGRAEITGLDGFGLELTDAAAIRLRFLIHETFAFMPPMGLFEQALIDLAHTHRYHPVRDYLDGLKWDWKPRIDTWLQDYAGAAATPFVKAVGRIFLVAGVRRIRKPGTKFDTLLVFESRQGMDKSVALRALAVRDEWFTDNLPLGSGTKEVIEQTRGVWIAEFAELSGIERRDVNHIKNFLSKQDDRARPAYGRRMETVPRQFIAAGSTNDQQYLLDMENRRFLPVKIKRFETAKLSRDVEQLWAEASHYEAEGEPVTLQEDLWGAAAEEQSAREVESPLKEMIARRLGREEAGWIPANEVWEILGVSATDCHRLAKPAGQAMTALGFERKQQRGDGDKGARGDRFYERGDGAGGRLWWRQA